MRRESENLGEPSRDSHVSFHHDSHGIYLIAIFTSEKCENCVNLLNVILIAQQGVKLTVNFFLD